MKIHGLQKMTLLDFPGKVACTIFFDGCQLRCPFCHNSELLENKAPALMDDQELLKFLSKRKGILDAVCISGGEPTLQPELETFIRSIKDLGYAVKLDTNGFRPDVLKHLVSEGLLDYVAMDIKNSPERYAVTCGLPSVTMAPVEESIRFLLDGHVDYEFRTTVIAEFHNEDSFHAIGKWLKTLNPDHKTRQFFLQPFMDRDTVLFSNLNAPSDEDLKKWADVLSEYSEYVQIRGI